MEDLYLAVGNILGEATAHNDPEEKQQWMTVTQYIRFGKFASLTS